MARESKGHCALCDLYGKDCPGLGTSFNAVCEDIIVTGYSKSELDRLNALPKKPRVRKMRHNRYSD
jgi:hypothetical protein